MLRFNLAPNSDDYQNRFERLVAFWTDLEELTDFGGASREELDSMRAQVNDCFAKGPSCILDAESITVRAKLLMIGADYD